METTKPGTKELITDLITYRCDWKDYFDYRIILLNEQYQGIGHVRITFYESFIAISDLHINEQNRRKGYGTRLLNELDRIIGSDPRQICIEAEESWQEEWYKSRGYTVTQVLD